MAIEKVSGIEGKSVTYAITLFLVANILKALDNKRQNPKNHDYS